MLARLLATATLVKPVKKASPLTKWKMAVFIRRFPAGAAAAAETDDDETGIVPHYRRWDGDIYPAAATSTEEVEGDGELEVDTPSELTIVRAAAETSDADAPAPTRVRRGMQELKN